IVSKVLKYIDENYEEASLKEIAMILKQPNYKISKLLKEFTGKNFRELLIEKRLEKVKKLLKNTDYPISEVIKNAGYENISYFYKLFKKTYNVSLKEYRNS
ncbi:MAG: helix-turn-helix transcriptional regulator, partial [Fusobacteriaceae bacterium]|nr:helix-turn-helix transcriptional regulator [Fusobacteriaceae bacterium]